MMYHSESEKVSNYFTIVWLVTYFTVASHSLTVTLSPLNWSCHRWQTKDKEEEVDAVSTEETSEWGHRSRVERTRVLQERGQEPGHGQVRSLPAVA